jgi:hypothetical protein
MFEQIVFMQTDFNAEEPLSIYDNEGTEAAIKYLMQWHYPGEHETSERQSAGTADTVIYGRDEQFGYVLTVNEGLGYIGLEYEEPLA